MSRSFEPTGIKDRSTVDEPYIAGGTLMRESNNHTDPGERNFAVIDGHSGAVTPVVPKINLSSLDDVRLEMSKVYRDMRASRIETSDGTRLVYVLGQLGKLHEVAEVAKRLASIEMAMNGRGK